MASPRPMTIIPSVMMKGGMPPKLMPSPFTAPMITPIARPARSTRGIGVPTSSSIAETTAVTATIEPTERSIPAVRITKVMPMETMPNNAIWRSTLMMLKVFRKTGEISAATMHMARRTQIRPEVRLVRSRTAPCSPALAEPVPPATALGSSIRLIIGRPFRPPARASRRPAAGSPPRSLLCAQTSR